MVCAVKTVANTLSIVRLLSQVVSCDRLRWLLPCSQCFPVASASCHLVVVGDSGVGGFDSGVMVVVVVVMDVVEVIVLVVDVKECDHDVDGGSDRDGDDDFYD